MLLQGTLSNTETSLLTLSTANVNLLKSFIFFNSSSSNDETIFLYVVKNDGGSVGVADNSNLIVEQILSFKETFEFSPAYPIEINQINDSIFAKASTNNTVNYLISGVEQQ